jgi:hypothetical protein
MVWVTVCYFTGGGRGGVGQICLHCVTQPYTTWPRWREQGEGLRSLPLVNSRIFCLQGRHGPGDQLQPEPGDEPEPLGS